MGRDAAWPNSLLYLNYIRRKWCREKVELSIQIGQGKISHLKVVKADAKKVMKNNGSA